MGREKGPCGRRKVTHEVKRVFPGPILVLFNVPDRARSSLCSRIPDRLLGVRALWAGWPGESCQRGYSFLDWTVGTLALTLWIYFSGKLVGVEPGLIQIDQ